MALTRKMLKAMGIEEEKIEQIIEAHTEPIDALKNELNGYKEKAEKFDEVQRELNELKSTNSDDWKSKFEAKEKELNDFKSEIAGKETLKTKTKAYTKLIETAGIKDKKLIDLIVRSVDFAKVELDGENIKDAEKLTTSLKEEYASFVTTEGTKGADVENPSKGGNETDLGKLDMKAYIEARKGK